MDTKLFTKALRFLTRRPRTEHEVRFFLKKQHASKEQIEFIISDLKKRRFIDDEAFAQQWIEARMRLKPKGWRVLKMELMQKGISEEVIQNYELRIKNHELDIPNEKALIDELVKKKITALKSKSREEIYRKLGGFLMRRGFSFEDSKRAIDEVLKNLV